jgi:hypothetical protein
METIVAWLCVAVLEALQMIGVDACDSQKVTIVPRSSLPRISSSSLTQHNTGLKSQI